MALIDVPLSGQTLGQTQNSVRTNFLVTSNTFAIDHVGYNEGNGGKHNKISFPLQSSVPTFLTNEIGLFDQNAAPTFANPALGVSVASRPDIWMARGVVSATNPIFPITGYNYTNNITGSTFWTYLPSGLKIIGGQSQVTIAGSIRTIVYNQTASGGADSFPGFFTPFVGSVQLTRINTTSNTTSFLVLNGYNVSGFSARASSSASTNVDFTWFAIGL